MPGKVSRSALSLFAVLSLAALLGCTKEVEPGGADPERSATTGAELSAPVTITLAAPNPVSPIAPPLEASNSVALGASDNVSGGPVVAMGTTGLSTQPGAVLAAGAWSRGTATLADRTNVQGTLHATTVSLGNSVVIASRDATPRFDPPSTLTWNVQFPSGTGPNVTLNSGQSQTLAPGLYGSVIVNSGATLTLSTGTYYVSSLQAVNSDSKVILQQANGSIIIYTNAAPILNGPLVTSGGLLGDGGASVQPDLLIAYLGTSALNVNSVFSGALIAPFAALTLNASTGTYVGFFEAQTINVQAGAKIRYAVPTAIVTAANPAGPVCEQLLASVVPPNLLAHYCHQCQSPDDTDRDGIPDCADQCPYDPKKTAPGACGCGSSEIDSDGDGVPDCNDLCPHDPNNAAPGQCGCLGDSSLKLAGTACGDTACPQSGATCNGAGVCGNRAACLPCTGGHFVNTYGTSYWVCPTPTTESNAQNACTAKGLTLARIHSLDENRFVAQLLPSPLWLGANDITTSGTWDWSAPGTNNGQQFWSGGPTGTPVNGLFSYWATGAPGSQRCAILQPSSGRWLDENCANSFGYACEFQTPIVRNTPLPPAGQSAQPPDAGACVDQFNLDAGGLPGSLQELSNDLDAALHDVFVGAAANPPARDASCPSDPDLSAQGLGIGPDSGGCWYTGAPLQISTVIPNAGPNGTSLTVQSDCIQDQDCVSQFGSGYFCRDIKNDAGCEPPDAGPGAPDVLTPSVACEGHALCIQMHCPPVSGSCREIQLCNPGTTFDASPDPTTNLDAGAYNPAQMFEGGVLPDAASIGFYSDPVDGAAGPNHPWCWMVPQHPVANAMQPDQNTNGSTGGGTTIGFSFDPNLEFKANANPLALGESGLDVHAGATLKASVSLNNFLGQSYTADVVDIGTGIDAERCSVNNNKTQFTVLGVDILSLTGLGVPKFDSTDLAPNATRECNQAVANFSLWANRAKKAFHDAQELLSQYKNITSSGGQLAGTLCHDIIDPIGETGIANFPGGVHCPTNEPPEITINRFVEYLQAPGIGQISQLRGAASQLVNKSQAIIDSVLAPLQQKERFLNISESESETILNVPFAIGPVPMVLQIDVFAAYGIAGNFQLKFTVPLNKLAGLDDTSNVANPSDPDHRQGTQIPLAHAEVDVLPYASAGLSAFVGAGVDLGAFSATVGIEGSVTLADIAAPVYAGAGIELTEQYDPRPIPAPIANVSVPDLSMINPVGSLFHFQLPKSFQFFVWFDYGAGIELDNVLTGEIDARLRISFLFFSKTWRKQIAHFNGWSKHFNLISGAFGAGSGGSNGQSAQAGPVLTNGKTDQSTTLVSGTPSMGLGEMQLPLTVLQSLPVPDGGSSGTPDAGDAGGDAGDSGQALAGQTVKFDAGAIEGMFYDDLCCIKTNGGSCSLAGTPQCCPGFTCTLQQPGNVDSGVCVPQCVQNGDSCSNGGTCCAGLVCDDGAICLPPPPQCVQTGGVCGGNLACCSGNSCQAGVCTLVIIVQ